MKKKNSVITLFLVTVLAMTALSACGSETKASAGSLPGTTVVNPSQTQAASAATQSITVNSTEKVSVVPDIAQIVYAVRTESKDAAGCQAKNTEDVNKVIETLKGLGVDEKSIQTSDYNMYPVYDYSNDTQKITSYEATSTLTVSGVSIDGLGNVLSQSVLSGINSIQSITYQSSSYDVSYQEALKLAVESAGQKALALAEAGNCSLGGVVKIVENSNYTEARYTDNALAAKMNSATEEMALDARAASVMPGEVEVEVNITVEYQIGGK